MFSKLAIQIFLIAITTLVTSCSDGMRSRIDVKNIFGGGANRSLFSELQFRLDDNSNSLVQGECKAINLDLLDQRGDRFTLAQALQVDLTGDGIGIYADAACVTPKSVHDFSAGQSSASFYVMGLTEGLRQIEGESDDLIGFKDFLVVQNIAYVPDSLRFVNEPLDQSAHKILNSFEVEVLNDAGVRIPAEFLPAAETLSVRLKSPASSTWLLGTKDQNLQALGLSTFDDLQVVKSGTGYQLVAEYLFLSQDSAAFDIGGGIDLKVTTPERAIQAGACSQELRIAVQDIAGAESALLEAVTIDLAHDDGDSNLKFYSSNTCAALDEITQITIGVGQTFVNVYASSDVVGVHELSFSATDYNSDTQNFTINPAPAATLAYTSASQTLPSGTCSAVVEFVVQDALGNLANLSQNIDLETLDASMEFYASNDCSGAPISFVALNDESSGQFTFKTTQSGTPDITIETLLGGITPATQSHTIEAGVAEQMAFTTASQDVVAGVCSGVVTIEFQDSFGNRTALGADQTLDLTFAGGKIFTSATCEAADEVTSVIASTGAFEQNLYFSKESAGAVNFEVANTVFTNISQSQNILPAAPYQLSFALTPAATPAGEIILTGASASLRVDVLDEFGNKVVSDDATSVEIQFVSNPTSATLNGVTTKTATDGEVLFDDLMIELAGSYTIKAVASALTQPDSLDVPLNITSAPLNQIAFATSALDVVAGSCSGPIEVILADQFGNAQVSDQVEEVVLSGSGMSFFTDGACANALAANTLSYAIGESSKEIYVRAIVAGSIDLNADHATLVDGLQTQTIRPAAAFEFRFDGLASNIDAGSCSAFRVQVYDEFGNLTTVTADTSIDLNKVGAVAADVTFYSENTCSVPANIISSTTILDTESTSIDVYLYPTVVGDLDVSTTSLTSINDVTQSVTIDPAPASKIQITDYPIPPLSTVAGACSSAIELTTLDVFDNIVAVDATQNFNLTGTGLSFYLNEADCLAKTDAVTAISFFDTQSVKTFYYSPTAAGTHSLAVAHTGSFTGDAKDIDVIAAPPSQLVFVDGAGDLASGLTSVAGECSGVLRVQARDPFDNPSAVSQDSTISITDLDATATFYTENTCTTAPVTSVTMLNTQMSAEFYYKDTMVDGATPIQPGNLPLEVEVTVGEAEFLNATQTQNQTILPAAADALEFLVNPSDAVAGAANSPAIEVILKDEFGNRAYTSSATIDLAIDNNPGTSTLGGTVSVATIANEGRAVFTNVTLDKVAVGYTLEASSGALTIDTSSAFDITPAPPATMAILSVAQTVVAGECSADPVQLEIRDQFGNLYTDSFDATPNFSGSGLSFHPDALCNDPLPATLNFSSGLSQVYFSGTLAGAAITLNVAATGITGVAQDQTIEPAAAASLHITQFPAPLQAGLCSSAVVVETRDEFDNVTPKGDFDTLLTLNPASANFTFFSSNTCTGGTEITQVNIPEGSSSAQYYYRSTTVGTFNLEVDHASLVADSQAITIGAAPPNKLGFIQQPTDQVAGVNLSPSVQVAVQDQFGNTVTTSSAKITMAIESSPGSAVMTGANEVNAVAGVATFTNLSFDLVGAYEIRANALLPNPSIISSVFNITPAPISQITYETLAQTLDADECSAQVDFVTRDQFGNISNLEADTVFTLAPGGLTFYSDGACTGGNEITDVTLLTGASAGLFFYKTTVAASYDLTTASTGLTSAVQTTVIEPLAATKIAYTTPEREFLAGACSPVMTVQTQDVFNNTSAVVADTDIAFTDNSADVILYTTPTCTAGSELVGNVTISAAQSDASIYARSIVPTSFNLSADTTLAATPVNATQTSVVIPAPPDELRITTPAYTIGSPLLVGTCSNAVTVELYDEFGNSTTSGTGLNLNLSGEGMTFYSDAGCGTDISGVVAMGAGLGSTTFYFRGTKSEEVDLTVSAAGATDSVQQHYLLAETPSQLGFASTAQTIVAGNCSGAMSAQSQDLYGNRSELASLTSVDLSGVDLTFYSDAACSTPVTTTSIAASDFDSTPFYFSGTVSGLKTATAASVGLTSGTQDQTVEPDAAVSLAYTTEPTDGQAGSAMPTFAVTMYDQYSNIAQTTTKSISVIFEDNPSAATLGGTTSVSTVNGVATFTAVNIEKTGIAYSLRAQGADLTDAVSAAFDINPAAPTQLVFDTLAVTETAGACSPVVSIQTQDAFDNPSPVASDLTVNAGGDFYQFFTTPDCSDAALSEFTILQDTSTVSLYFQNTRAGVQSLLIEATGYTPASQDNTIVADVPSQVAFIGETLETQAGVCSAAVSLEVQDQFGNKAVIASAAAVDFSTLGVAVDLYAGATCASAPITQAQIPAPANLLEVYYKGEVRGDFDLSAVSATYEDAVQTHTVNSSTPVLADYATAEQTVRAGVCSDPVRVELYDEFGNITPAGEDYLFAISATGVDFFTDAACTTSSAGAFTIANGQEFVEFYFVASQTGDIALAMTQADLAVGANQPVTVLPGLPSYLEFMSDPTDRLAGQVFDPALVVAVRDIYDNIVNDSSIAITMTIGTNPGSAALVGDIVINAVEGIATFSNLVIEKIGNGYTLSATSLEATNGTSASFNVTALPATRLSVVTPPQAISVGNCSGIMSVQSQDLYLNPSAVATNTTVDLAGPNTTFYSDSTCETLITQRTINAGQSLSSFYFKTIVAGTETLSLSDNASFLSSTTQEQTITAAAPVNLAFTSPAQTLVAGECSEELSVTAQDEFGNNSVLSTNLNVALSGSDATFYSEDTCSNVLPFAQIVSGQHTANFYYKNETAGVFTLRGEGGVLVAATQDHTINPDIPDKLRFMTEALNTVAGICSGAVTIELLDQFDNRSAATSNAVDLSVAAGTAELFSDATCTTPITTPTVAIGEEEVTFYYKQTTAGPLGITINSGTLTPASQIHTIIPEIPDRLEYLSAAQSLIAGDCSAVLEVAIKDIYNNNSYYQEDKTLQFIDEPVIFYSTPGCAPGTEVTQLALPALQSVTSLYFRSTKKGTHTITTSFADAALPPIDQSVAIDNDEPFKIGYSAESIEIVAGSRTHVFRGSSQYVRLQVQDQFGNSAPVTDPLVEELETRTSGTAGSTLTTYSTGSTTANNEFLVPIDGSTFAIYLAATRAGEHTLFSIPLGTNIIPLQNGQMTVTVTPWTPESIIFAPLDAGVQPSFIAGECSPKITARIVDRYGNASPVAATKAIDFLIDQGTDIQLYSDENCTIATTVDEILAEQSDKEFYFNSQTSQDVIFNVSSTFTIDEVDVLQEDDITITVLPKAPTQLVFDNPASNVAAGNCSSQMNLQMKDDLLNNAALTEDATIRITYSDNTGNPVTLYSDPNCNNVLAGVGDLYTIPAGQTGKPFYFKTDASFGMTYTFLAEFVDPVGYTIADGTQAREISEPVAAVLELVDNSNGRNGAANCSQEIILNTYNVFGSPTNVKVDQSVEIIGSTFPLFDNNPQIFTDPLCQNQVGSVTIPADSDTASFYYKINKPDNNYTLIARADDFESDIITLNILQASKIVFTTDPHTMAYETCSPAIDIQVQGTNDQPVNVDQDTVLALSTTSAGWNTYLEYFPTSSCTDTTQITEVTIPTGESTATVHVRRRVEFDMGNPLGPEGAVTLTAQNIELINGEQTHFIYDARLAYASAGQNIVAGTCSGEFIITARNSQSTFNVGSNVVFTIGPPSWLDSPNVEVFTDSSCTTVAPDNGSYYTGTIATGTDRASFWIRSTSAFTVKLDVVNSQFERGEQFFTVRPDEPKSLDLNNVPTEVLALDTVNCEDNGFQLRLRDQYGNLGALAGVGGEEVNLTTVIPGDMTFYTNSSCTGLGVTSVTIPEGDSLMNVYFTAATDTETETKSLTATAVDPNLNPTSANVKVITRTFDFVTSELTAQLNECTGPVTVQLTDIAGANKTISTTTNIPVSAQFTQFYSDAGCTTTTSDMVFNATEGLSFVYFVSSQMGTYPITLSHPDFIDQSQNKTTEYAQNFKFALAATQTMTAGVRYDTIDALRLSILDQLDRPVSLDGYTTVNLNIDGKEIIPSHTSDASFSRFVRSGGGYSGCDSDWVGANLTTGFRFAPDKLEDRLYNGTIGTHTCGETNWLGITLKTAGTRNIEISATGFDTTSVELNVIPNVLSSFGFLGEGQTLNAGQCSALSAVQVEDSFGNAVVNPLARNVDLISTNATFFSGADCIPGNEIETVSFAAGENSKPISFIALRAPITRLRVTDDRFFEGSPGGVDYEGLDAGFQDQIISELAMTEVGFALPAEEALPIQQCSAEQIVQLQDIYGNPRITDIERTITLGAAAGVSFFWDDTCATPIPANEVVIPIGDSLSSFYFSSTLAGDVEITGTTAGLDQGTITNTIIGGVPQTLEFNNAPYTLTANQCSSAVVASIRDSFGNFASSTTDTFITIDGGGTNIYSDEFCINPIAAITIPAGEGEGTFYFRENTAGTVTLEIDSASLAAQTQDHTIVPGTAVGLDYGSAAQTVVAGNCSPSFTRVVVEDAYNNVSQTTADVSVNLSAPNTTFYSDSSCTLEQSSYTIANGGSGFNFYFKATNAGSLTITAASLSYPSASQVQTIEIAPANRLRITSVAKNQAAGACSTVLTVRSEDEFGNASAVASDALLEFAGEGMTFYTTNDCNEANVFENITLASGQTSRSFYFKGTKSGVLPLNITSTGYSSASQDQTITAGAPTQLGFGTDPRTVVAGACSQAATVRVEDSFGNMVPAPSNITVNLSGSNVSFFSNSSCSASTTTATISQTTTGTTFYFRSTLAGTKTIDVTGSGLTAGTQDQEIIAALATRLKFITDPLNQQAGACGEITLQARDTYANPAPIQGSDVNVALPFTGSDVEFFTDNLCSAPLAGDLPLLVTESQKTFYARSIEEGTIALSASASGFTGDGQTHTITAAAPTRLAFGNDPLTTPAGSCSAAISLEIHDIYGNSSEASEPILIDLSGSDADLSFFSDDSCTTSVTSATIATGTKAALVYARSTKAGDLNINLTTLLAFDDATQVKTINPLAPNTIDIQEADQQIAVASCFAMNVDFKDTYGNVSALTSPRTLNFSTIGVAGEFHLNAACSDAAVTSLFVSTGVSTRQIYFRSYEKDLTTVVISSAGFTTATIDLELLPAPPTHLGVGTLEHEFVAGTCSPLITIESQDEFGNRSAVTQDTLVNLTADSTGQVTYYSTAACTPGSEITNVTLLQDTDSAGIYFSSQKARAHELTFTRVSGDTLLSFSQTHTVIADDPIKLGLREQNLEITAGVCSLVHVESQDTYGNASTIEFDALVDLALTGVPVSAYSDAGCTSSILSTTIANTTNSSQIYLRSTQSGSASLELSTAAALTLENVAFEVVPAAPTKLEITTTAQTILAGECSAPVNLRVLDAFDNIAAPSAAVPVTFANSSAELEIFDGAGCSGGAVTGISFSGGVGEREVSFRSTTAGSYTFLVEGTGLSSANQSAVIDPNVATTISFLTAAQTVTAGACSAITTLELQDDFGNPSNPVVNRTLDLTGANFQFFSDAGCSSAIATVDITTMQTQANFYFRNNVAATQAINAEHIDLVNATQNQTIESGGATQLAIISPYTNGLSASSCSVAHEVRSQDGFGNTTNVASSTTVNFTTTEDVKVYSDFGCMTEVTSLTIDAASSSVSFYMRNDTAQPYTLSASATGLAQADRLFDSFATGPILRGVVPPSTPETARDYGFVTTDASETFVFKNLGSTITGALTLNLVSESAQYWDVSVNNCVAPLAAAEECSVTVVFKGSEAPNGFFYYAKLQIESDLVDNDDGGGTHNIDLQVALP